MSPSVRATPTGFELGADRRTPTPRAATLYACALLAAALSLVVALAATGSPWPAPGALLVLVIPLAVCVNRYVFYPNEVGASAEAAVVFAAMVAFHETAPWLGPLLLAVLLGLLQVEHWGDRAFVRMAYNSGNTVVVTCGGLVVFDLLTSVLGTSWPALFGAAILASVPYLIAELGSGVLLAILLGGRAADAVLHPRLLNVIALPLAVVGALAGAAALEVGWWAALLVLLPMPLVPELVVMGGGHPAPRVRSSTVLLALAAIAGIGWAAVNGAPADLPTLGVLVVTAAALGIDCRVDGPRPVPPPAFVIVVAALAVLPHDERLLAAVGGALVATASSFLLTPAPPPWWRAVLVAGAGAAGAAASFALLTPRHPVPADAVVPSAIAGAVFLVVAVRRAPTLVWCAPLLAAVAAAAALWREVGSWAFVGAALFVFVGASAWGSFPWSSRALGPWSSEWRPSHRRATQWIAVGTTIVCLTLAAFDGPDRTVLTLGALVASEAVLAMAMFTVRQWRFAPRRRTVECATLAIVSAVGMGGVVVFAPERWPAAAGLILIVVAVGVLIARPLASVSGSEPVRRR